MPQVQLYVGHAPVSTAWVRQVLGPHCAFTVVPPADVCPYVGCLTRKKQIDHTGTHRLPPQPAEPAEPPRTPERSPLEVYLHDVVVHFDNAA